MHSRPPSKNPWHTVVKPCSSSNDPLRHRKNTCDEREAMAPRCRRREAAAQRFQAGPGRRNWRGWRPAQAVVGGAQDHRIRMYQTLHNLQVDGIDAIERAQTPAGPMHTHQWQVASSAWLGLGMPRSHGGHA